MIFLTKTDLKGSIADDTLASLQGAADANLNEAETLAISEIAPLRGSFAIEAELAKTGTARNTELKRMLCAITVYYLYNTVHDDAIPLRVVDNYNTELKKLEKIASGKAATTIDRITDETGKQTTNFRYNVNQSPRSLDPYRR